MAGSVMRVKLVAGNWKMNGNLASNQALLQALIPALSPIPGVECVVCAPFPYVFQLQQALHGSSIAWGAQDLCQFDNGAYTGGVSAAMLADFGCRYVIVGHSERRSVFGETDKIVALKFAQALKSGLTPILCVGETLGERDSGVTEMTVARQLDAVMAHSGVKTLAQAVHAFIRNRLAATDAALAGGVLILYGGSVKAASAAQLFAMPDIDGGLIGGASLIVDEFAAICRAAQPPA